MVFGPNLLAYAADYDKAASQILAADGDSGAAIQLFCLEQGL
jgi:hypothetical protein